MILFISFYLFSVHSQEGYYDTCSEPAKYCSSPTEIMTNPNLSKDISFEEGLECHMTRFLKDHNPEPPAASPLIEVCEPSLEEYSWLQRVTSQIRGFEQEYAQVTPPSSPIPKKPPIAIDPICFHGSSLRHKKTFNSKTNFYYCPDYNAASPQRGHPQEGACLSKSYSKKLATVFDQITSCLNFCKQDKYEFFKIINHESAFAPNARSPSRARCMGQLTKNTINELQQNLALKILYPNSQYVINYDGFDLKNSACDYLDQYTIPPNFRKNLFPYTKKIKGGQLRGKTLQTYSHFSKEGQSQFYYECKVLSNPVQCLLYAALNHRKNMNTYMNSFQAEEVRFFKDSLKNSTEEDKVQFAQFVDEDEIGLSPTELYVSRSQKSNPKLFRTTGGAYKEFHKMQNEPSLKMEKINIFSEEDMKHLRTLILQISYNGGNAIVRTMAKSLISDLRDYIADPHFSSNKDKYIGYRENLLKGIPIPLKEIKTELIQELSLKISRRKSRQKELRNYHKEVVEHTDYLLEEKGHSMKQHFSDHIGNNFLSEQFSKEVRDKCSVINRPASSCK